MKKTETLVIRINPQVKEDFKRLCQSNDISMTVAITALMEKELDQPINLAASQSFRRKVEKIIREANECKRAINKMQISLRDCK